MPSLHLSDFYEIVLVIIYITQDTKLYIHTLFTSVLYTVGSKAEMLELEEMFLAGRFNPEDDVQSAEEEQPREDNDNDEPRPKKRKRMCCT